MNNGGKEAMMHDLLALDFSHINLREIPRTKALFEQIYSSMSTVKKFWYEKLKDGSLSDNHDGWQGEIPFKNLHSEYLVFSKSLNDKHPIAPQQFGTQLRKLCKNVKEVKRNIDGKRILEKIFPSLDECRKEFERLVKMEGEITWDDTADFGTAGLDGLVK